MRDKRLLMHKKEIKKLYEQVKREGLTLVPLSMYFKGSRVKIQVGLCKGKKLHDKRDSIAERDVKRKLDRVMKNRGG
jgi:SsrA-binding protein